MKDDLWVIVDTETDGLSEPIHVVEIGAQLMKGREAQGEPFRIFLNHGVPIPPAAVAIHGYTEKFLAQNGIPPAKAHQEFKSYACNLPLVSHNLAYDWNAALYPEWLRLGVEPVGRRGFCSMMLARRVVEETKTYRLEALKDCFGIKGGCSHHAVDDATTVAKLFDTVYSPRLDAVGIDTFDDVADFSRKTPVAKCLSQITSLMRMPKAPVAPSPKDEWYILDDKDQPHGPYSAASIYTLTNGSSCYIWREGMKDWAASTDVPEFLEVVRGESPLESRSIAATSKTTPELIALCRGLMADSKLTTAEVMYLSEWLRDAGCINEWPAAEIAQMLERILEDRKITKEEKLELSDLLKRVS
jgi:DNA polymerase III epsilon subunit-like protein